MNAETNAAPRPRDLTARVLGGTRVRIAVPLDGIDADGDSVELVGLASSPAKGRITETGSDYLVYEAFDDTAGVDTFTYRVRDRLGAEATATIRVGIAPAEGVNQAPYAVKDSVIMRPDRSVAVPVLANDSDPDGDEYGIVKNGLILPDVAGLEAKVEGNRVVVTSPSEPIETSLQYTIRDARGAEAKAVLQITVAEDVPLQKPIARDDYVRAADVEDGVVDLEVLANDEDPDGTVDDLELSVADADSRVLSDGTVRITLGDADRLATYTITDRDGNEASAFIHIPALVVAAAHARLDRADRGRERRDRRAAALGARPVRRRRQGRHHRGGEGDRGAQRRVVADQGPDDARLHVGRRVLRARRDHVRGHRRHRPRRSRRTQGDADPADHRAAAREPAAGLRRRADGCRARRGPDDARPRRTHHRS